jgi:uncharacterized protein (TIGR00251 family)
MTVSRIRARLTPRASRDEVLGFEGEVLRVRVKAPPVEGRANEAVLRLLAKVLRVSRSSLTIVRGQASRDKIVKVEGLDAPELGRRIELGRSRVVPEARGPARWPGRSPEEG